MWRAGVDINSVTPVKGPLHGHFPKSAFGGAGGGRCSGPFKF